MFDGGVDCALVMVSVFLNVSKESVLHRMALVHISKMKNSLLDLISLVYV